MILQLVKTGVQYWSLVLGLSQVHQKNTNLYITLEQAFSLTAPKKDIYNVLLVDCLGAVVLLGVACGVCFLHGLSCALLYDIWCLLLISCFA